MANALSCMYDSQHKAMPFSVDLSLRWLFHSAGSAGSSFYGHGSADVRAG